MMSLKDILGSIFGTTQEDECDKCEYLQRLSNTDNISFWECLFLPKYPEKEICGACKRVIGESDSLSKGIPRPDWCPKKNSSE